MQSLQKLDFTLQKYELLCRTILDCGYNVYTVLDYLSNQREYGGKYGIIMRHDVDRRPLNALRMAQLEARYGISTTYYFRAKKHTFIPSIIRKVASLGHEIGYHYEGLSDAGGDRKKAIVNFERNLARFRDIVPTETICMHGSPLSKWNNKDLWLYYDYINYGIVGDAFLSIDYSHIVYFSDTGRTWNPKRDNVRDKLSTAICVHSESTIDLIELLQSKRHQLLSIQCHPERWPDTLGGYALSLCMDMAANLLKRLIIRRTRWSRKDGDLHF